MSLKIAHIVPTQYLPLIVDKHSYHLCLTHMVREDQAYTNWYKTQSDKGSYVILDNGIYEGVETSVDELLDCAERVHAKEIVLPDVFRAVTSTERTLEALDNPMFKDMPSTSKFAAVVHGKDRSTWIQSFDTLSSDSRIHTLMLPKVLDEVWGYGGRFAACAYLEATGRVDKSKTYHLLGVWTDPIEVYLHAVHHTWIRGLDTALAFQAGYQEVSLSYLSREGGHKPKRPQSYFSINQLTNIQSVLVRTNVDLLDMWGEAKTKHGK
jgi:hypothetical protein